MLLSICGEWEGAIEVGIRDRLGSNEAIAMLLIRWIEFEQMDTLVLRCEVNVKHCSKYHVKMMHSSSIPW